MRNRLFHCFIVKLLKINTAIRERPRAQQCSNLAIQRGFTVVELLLYMGLLSIFLMILIQLFVSILDVSVASNNVSNVAQDARFILARLAYDIRRADSITTPASLGGSGNTLSISIGGTSYTYSLSGQNIALTVGAASAQNLNTSQSKLSTLQFKRIGNSGGKDTIQITFTLESVGSGSPEQESYQTTIGLR